MAHEDQGQYAPCPHCSFGSHDSKKLARHLRHFHSDEQSSDESILQPVPSSPADRHSDLTDFELAQILAFEEAGLPRELALSDPPSAPSSKSLSGTSENESLSRRQSHPARANDTVQWVECFCGEQIHILELGAHSEMHAQEKMSIEDSHLVVGDSSNATSTMERPISDISNAFTTTLPDSLRNYDQMQAKTPQSRSKRRGPSLKEIFLGMPAGTKKKAAVAAEEGKTRRLGKAELGPYAHERQMPNWLRRMLEEGAKVSVTTQIAPDGKLVRVEHVANETPNLVPVLARLSQLDRNVERAFYCSPAVRHVCKMSREGGFCGYRNIQMMISYIQSANPEATKHFPGRLPNILRLQDFIEDAWDQGFNPGARIETGGIRLTRKYIGTPEAEALFLSLDIPCEPSAYTTTGNVEAVEAMLCAVCEYFDDESSRDNLDKVVVTEKPPIYFQHRGHSMTIVGVESNLDGDVNLVVFDPMFNPSPALKKIALSNNTSFRCAVPAKLLKGHRRTAKYLGRYQAFELLRLL
ncbi:hypothetical protein PV08_04102 [Exophiala spinifera]|uniref:UFSP1/2/DUB catalytic domain-containing protein n=1 Tax=Exophiala spinifera TaxID=91928 RepID=A0A0D1ZW48_9EURO|nr:uncharacterized protein PV08_04102 [Exophiala spinifera]KIW16912.1 hypothetical protein PV08_04102 [Exophiala spinifera]